MARRDALLQLHKSLLSRRADIRKKLADELDGLRNLKGADAGGDPAGVAFESGSEEMASQLAELDSRELHQIERALHRLKQGTYGVCEGCGCKIPVARLNALPYTTLCIACQREMEKYPDWGDRRCTGSWEKVYDAASLEEHRESDAAGEALEAYQHFQRWS
jgi:DnaK suppressor protein